MADLISCSLSARRAATTRWRRMETKSKALKYVVCSRLTFLNRKISITFLHLVFHYHHWNDCTEGLHSYIQTFEEDVLLLHIGWRPAMAEFSTWLIVSGWEPLSYLDWMYGWTVVCISYKSRALSIAVSQTFSLWRRIQITMPTFTHNRIQFYHFIALSMWI